MQVTKWAIERYKNKERLQRYVNRAKNGLYSEEKILVRKYIKQNAKILVVGCGTGREIIGLKRLHYNNIIGIDISPDMIREAKKVLKKTKFYTSDINEFQTKEKFDAIIYFNNILEQIPSSEDRIKALRKAKELLEKDGIMIFSTHSRFISSKYGIDILKNFFLDFLYKVKLKKTSPYDYFDENEKIYAHYSNPFKIKKIMRSKKIKLLEINSRKYIRKQKNPRIRYIFDEPVYYVYRAKDI